MLSRIALMLCTVLLAGCASTLDNLEVQKEKEAAYYEEVIAHRQPKNWIYLYKERDFVVAVGSADLGQDERRHRVIQRAEEESSAELQELVRPWVVEMMEEYGEWFEWLERRPDSELVGQMSKDIARTAMKVWGRFYFTVGKYQTLRCVHESQVETHILSEALAREGQSGGEDVDELIIRMNRAQARHIAASRQFDLVRQ